MSDIIQIQSSNSDTVQIQTTTGPQGIAGAGAQLVPVGLDGNGVPIVNVISPYGIDSNGQPYYDPNGVVSGEEAYLDVDANGNLVLTKIILVTQ